MKIWAILRNRGGNFVFIWYVKGKKIDRGSLDWAPKIQTTNLVLEMASQFHFQNPSLYVISLPLLLHDKICHNKAGKKSRNYPMWTLKAKNWGHVGNFLKFCRFACGKFCAAAANARGSRTGKDFENEIDRPFFSTLMPILEI